LLPSTIGATIFVKVTVTNAQGQVKTAYFGVTVTNNGLCSDRSTSSEGLKVGIAYPNPTDGYFNLLIQTMETDGKLIVTDLSGKKVSFEQQKAETEFGMDVQIKMPFASNGVYFYQYQGLNTRYSGKIIINK
jgi:hypothetical protein